MGRIYKDQLRWLAMGGDAGNGNESMPGKALCPHKELLLMAKLYCRHPPGLVDYDESEQKAAHQLMNLGRRRATFLWTPSNIPPPHLFGISKIEVLCRFSKMTQCIQFSQ